MFKGGFIIYERMLMKSKQLDEQIQIIQNQLKEMPEGKLICCNSNWYQSDGHKKTYIPKENKEFAEKLAVKKYLTNLLEDLQHERKAIGFYLRHHTNYEPKADKMLTQSSEIKNLLSSHFQPLSKQLDNWMKSPYEHNLKYSENLVHKVSANEYVRSKSEAIIGKVLRMNKIPYRYECLLILDGIYIYPDFTIRHPKTGEYFYWEHFGLMDQASYVENMHTKLKCYTSNHIMPSINLITTYETKENPLTFEMVEMLVHYYFV